MRKIVLSLIFSLLLIGFILSCDTPKTVSTLGKELKVYSELRNENLYNPFKVVKSGKRIFILDKGDDMIKVFNEKGKLLNTIGSKGEAPGEYPICVDFFIYLDSVYMLSPTNSRIYLFNQKGKFLKSVKLDIFNPLDCVITPSRMFLTTLSFVKDKKIIHCFKRGEEKPTYSFLNCIPVRGLNFSEIYKNMGWLTASNGRVYFAYCLSNEVLEFSYKGNLIKKYKIPLESITMPEFRKKSGGKEVKKGMLILRNALNWDLKSRGCKVYLLSRDEKGNSIIFRIEKGIVTPEFKIKDNLISFDIYEGGIIGINENAEVFIYRTEQ